MSPTELKTIIQNVLSDTTWQVTVNEASMLNLTADDYEHNDGFVYVEEFNTGNTSFARYGMVETQHNDVYFCRLADIDATAEQREYIRETYIMPTVRKVEKALHDAGFDGVFAMDKYPRGFDACEVLVHISFDKSENVC